ncbi:hypothetical protein EJ08DRAFT_679096 [Tothia fuscella]|uniref:F-box domain-containing protein n=1 Tax=Tothia fuscella TaxID=1048955 RepID=A0A9P4TYQ4_9PEZI|nr:hypothetical protein EJ08DRAFT_679096 [Tothia fuscella]
MAVPTPPLGTPHSATPKRQRVATQGNSEAARAAEEALRLTHETYAAILSPHQQTSIANGPVLPRAKSSMTNSKPQPYGSGSFSQRPIDSFNVANARTATPPLASNRRSNQFLAYQPNEPPGRPRFLRNSSPQPRTLTFIDSNPSPAPTAAPTGTNSGKAANDPPGVADKGKPSLSTGVAPQLEALQQRRKESPDSTSSLPSPDSSPEDAAAISAALEASGSLAIKRTLRSNGRSKAKVVTPVKAMAMRPAPKKAVRKRKSSKASISALPKKLMECIALHVGTPTLFRLREVNKAWNEACWPAYANVFKSSAVFLEGKSLDLLNTISKQPVINKSIEDLHLMVTRWKDQETRKFEEILVEQHEEIPIAQHRTYRDMAMRSQPYPWFDPRDEHSTKLMQHDITALEEVVKNLKSLKSVHIGDFHAETALGSAKLQRHLGLLPSSMFEDYEANYRKELPDFGAALTRTLLITLAVLGTTHPSLENLTTASKKGNTPRVRGLPLAMLPPTAFLLFEHLIHLHLQLDASLTYAYPALPASTLHKILGMQDVDSEMIPHFIHPGILAFAPNVECLHLEIQADVKDEKRGYERYFQSFLQLLIFPRIREFRFTGQSVPFSGLTSFLSRHSRTLRVLELGDMGLWITEDCNEESGLANPFFHRNIEGGGFTFREPKENYGHWVDILDFLWDKMGLESVKLWELRYEQTVEGDVSVKTLFGDQPVEIDDGLDYAVYKLARSLEDEVV